MGTAEMTSTTDNVIDAYNLRWMLPVVRRLPGNHDVARKLVEKYYGSLETNIVNFVKQNYANEKSRRKCCESFSIFYSVPE